MNAFQNLGYSAENELSPDAWKQFMLQELDKRDYYEKERLARYQRAQAQMEANRKREALKAGIKDALSYGISSFMNRGEAQSPGSEFLPGGQTIEQQMSQAVNPMNPVNSLQQPWPWER